MYGAFCPLHLLFLRAILWTNLGHQVRHGARVTHSFVCRARVIEFRPVGSKNQTGLGLCREHGIVWGRMVAIGQITLANRYDAPLAAVVIEIKELHRHSACRCLPNNA
jgi:hypothetical protein